MSDIPKIVVFDLGKVLVDFDYGIAVRAIASHSNTTDERVKDFLLHSPLLVRYESGLLSNQEFFDEIRNAIGFCGTIEEFGEFFSDIFVPIGPMIELHARLRKKGFPTYIFSNTNDLAVRNIRRNFPFFRNFEGYILSYLHKAMKPDAKLYEVLERETRCRGGEILYLDDRPENIAAGALRGWQTILHESPEKTRAELEQRGILNGV
jgi:putative hydrolase of the HAD superfamily